MDNKGPKNKTKQKLSHHTLPPPDLPSECEWQWGVDGWMEHVIHCLCLCINGADERAD